MDKTYLFNDNDSKDILHLVSLFGELDLHSRRKSNKNTFISNNMDIESNCKIIIPYDFTYDTIMKKLETILNNNIQI